jgi:hypothetical protein
MEEIATVDLLSMGLLGVIDAGLIFRFIYCSIMISMSRDGGQAMIDRRRKTLIIFIIANSLAALNSIAMYYWG